MTGTEFLKRRKVLYQKIEELEKTIRKLEKQVKIPKNIRPATPADVVEGNFFWYHPGTENEYWQIIEEVRWPDDDFKAFVAEDGCRYGLHRAFVEV